MNCPTCGEDTMISLSIPNLRTKFEGEKIIVKDAIISRCTNCDETLYGAKELKRWKKIKLEEDTY